jgi:hypothetical protein
MAGADADLAQRAWRVMSEMVLDQGRRTAES